MRDDKERLVDILDAIKILEKSLHPNKELYLLNELEFLGVIRCIEVLGEACKNLSDDFKNKYPDVPWRQIANMRNILIHQYFKIDTEKVEKVVKQDLPALKLKIQEIMKS